MKSSEYYKKLVADVLYENNLMDDEIYEKCSKPKHIQALPGDGRTNDPELLQKRKDAIISKWKEVNNEINEKNYPEEFWDMAQGDGDRWDGDRGVMISVDSEKVVDYYDNLLATHMDLNDVIRERYDSQINTIQENMEGYKSQVLNMAKSITEYKDKNEKLEKEISKDVKNLRIANDKLENLQDEYDKQLEIQNKIEDYNAVIEQMERNLDLPDGWDVAWDSSSNMQELIERYNNISPGLGDYVAEVYNLEEQYAKGRRLNTIQSDIEESRNNIHDLNFNITANSQQVASNNDTIRKYTDEKDWNNRQLKNAQKRVQYLKNNKPKKSNKDSAYDDLVNKKNLAIEFNNDCNKARDFQEELGNVNRKLLKNEGVSEPYDGFQVYNGIPQDMFGFRDIY